MVIAYHLIWTAYGCRLPNDPRGSTSRGVACPAIAELGGHHFGRRRVQPPYHVIHRFYQNAIEVLKFPLLRFRSQEFPTVAEAIQMVINDRRYTCYACAIMPDHIHVLVRKHRDKAEEMIDHFQESSRDFIRKNGLRSADHPVWTTGGWRGFLSRPNGIRRTI